MKEEEKELIAIDINQPADTQIKSSGTAYIRINDLYTFLKKCEEESKIIGFKWDGSRNFGVILQDK